ncbi:nucleoside deaminase [Desulfovibrio sp. JY]|nr:nucleoside deaminase [Desulfovibrio sp. JY]
MAEAFEAKVSRRVRELDAGALWRLERQVAAKREAWFESAAGRDFLGKRMTPRQAFETLFFSYMGLHSEDLPVVAESEDEIVWHSKNSCPTLEACLRSGRDTRQVCRAVYERPTQRFLSRLDPQLRFMRDYCTIRPHAPYCLERIVRVDFDGMMRTAIAEAKASFAEGNKGYGAVVAMGGDILAVGHDTAATDGDPSRHAEFKMLGEAVKAYGDTNLCGAVLVSTCEPCPMCAAMAVWCNVTSIVYGASIADTVAIGRTRIEVDTRTIVDNAPATIEVIGGVLKDDCLDLYRY